MNKFYKIYFMSIRNHAHIIIDFDLVELRGVYPARTSVLSLPRSASWRRSKNRDILATELVAAKINKLSLWDLPFIHILIT